jgi:hypothetical protein
VLWYFWKLKILNSEWNNHFYYFSSCNLHIDSCEVMHKLRVSQVSMAKPNLYIRIKMNIWCGILYRTWMCIEFLKDLDLRLSHFHSPLRDCLMKLRSRLSAPLMVSTIILRKISLRITVLFLGSFVGNADNECINQTFDGGFRYDCWMNAWVDGFEKLLSPFTIWSNDHLLWAKKCSDFFGSSFSQWIIMQ